MTEVWHDRAQQKKVIRKWLEEKEKFSALGVYDSQEFRDINNWIIKNNQEYYSIGSVYYDSDLETKKHTLLEELTINLGGDKTFQNFYKTLYDIESNIHVFVKEAYVDQLLDEFIKDINNTSRDHPFLFLIRFGKKGFSDFSPDFKHWFLYVFCRKMVLLENIKIFILNRGNCDDFKYLNPDYVQDIPFDNQDFIDIIKKTKPLYKQTIGTRFEDLGKGINQIGQELAHFRDPKGLDKNLSSLQLILSNICEKFYGNDKIEACVLIKKLNEEQEIEDKIPLINMIISKISSQIEIMDRKKIEINNPVFNQSNFQVGDTNKQEIDTLLNHNKDSRIKPEKPDVFKLITDPSTLAALAGFFSVEIGTYFYPVSYNHLIGIFIAVVILIIGIFIKHQKTKNV